MYHVSASRDCIVRTQLSFEQQQLMNMITSQSLR